MPYTSAAQQRWAHTPEAKAKGFPTREFDTASKGMKLPERTTKAKRSPATGRSMRGRR